ncbi:S1 family peptidase [Acinetobacter sp. YH01008]|jgi:hypothetical protein|nr:S1 family peptidase [Acinetobacter sp. YH01008]
MKSIFKLSILSLSFLIGVAHASPSDAIKLHASEYIKNHNVTLGEAINRLAIQESRSDVLSRIENKYADRLAGTYIEHDPIYKVVIRLKGNEPVKNFTADIKNLTSAGKPILQLPIEFQTGAFETKKEGLERLNKSANEIKHQFNNVQGLSYDERTGDIKILLFSELNEARSNTQNAQKLNLISSKFNNLPFKIEYINAKFQDTVAVKGGSKINTSGGYCTSAFAIKNSTGSQYMSTAAHCIGASLDVPTNAPLTVVGSQLNATRDVSWMTVGTGNTVSSQFNSSPTVTTQLTGRRTVANTKLNDTVCHNGANTGYSCGYIGALNFQPTYQGACGTVACSNTWIAVVGSLNGASGNGTLKCFSGDSGGPVFQNSIAFGILKGSSYTGAGSGQCNAFFYMSTDQIYNMGYSLIY